MPSKEQLPDTIEPGHAPLEVPFEFSPQGIGSVFGQIIRNDVNQVKDLGQFIATDIPVGFADLSQIPAALGGGVGELAGGGSFGEGFASSLASGQETLGRVIPGLDKARELNLEAGERAFGGDPLKAIITGLIAPGPGEIRAVRRMKVRGVSEGPEGELPEIPEILQKVGPQDRFTELDMDSFGDFLEIQGATAQQVAISKAAMAEGGFDSTAESLSRLIRGETRLNKRQSDIIFGISEPDNEALGKFIGRLGGINLNTNRLIDLVDDRDLESIQSTIGRASPRAQGMVSLRAEKGNFADSLGPVKLPEETTIFILSGTDKTDMVMMHEAGHAIIGIRDKTMSGQQFRRLLGNDRFQKLADSELLGNSQSLARPRDWERARFMDNDPWIRYASNPTELLADGLATSILNPTEAKILMPQFTEILQVMSETDPVIKSMAQFRGWLPIALAGAALREGKGFKDEGDL